MKKILKDKLKNAFAFFLTLFDKTKAASGLAQIKKIFCWFGAVFVAIFTVLFVKDCRIKSGNDTSLKEDDSDEINKKAAAKREETIERISRADARSICESYGSVCDTISDGKERFRQRCQRAHD